MNKVLMATVLATMSSNIVQAHTYLANTGKIHHNPRNNRKTKRRK